MEEQIDYTVTDKQVEEAITQEVFLQVGFKTSLCVLIVNTGYEAIGHVTTIDVKDVDIAEGKAGARKKALEKVKEHLEGIAQWRKAVKDFRTAEREAASARMTQEAPQAQDIQQQEQGPVIPPAPPIMKKVYKKRAKK